MMRAALNLLLGAMVALTATAPYAGATDDRPACAAVTELPDLPYYAGYWNQRPEFWQENNGFPGLQRVPCVDESGAAIDKDRRIETLPVQSVIDPDDPAGGLLGVFCNVTPETCQIDPWDPL